MVRTWMAVVVCFVPVTSLQIVAVAVVGFYWVAVELAVARLVHQVYCFLDFYCNKNWMLQMNTFHINVQQLKKTQKTHFNIQEKLRQHLKLTTFESGREVAPLLLT